jgi:nucleoside-diphosphate-sugar epimerase
MARAVVLGGTGFVGRYVCAALGGLGHEVLAVARKPGGSPGARFAALDRPDALAEILSWQRATVVVNAAGGVWDVSEQQMVESNVTLVSHLIDAAAGLGWRPRVVHLGSAHEYGAAPRGSLLDEESPTSPRTPYGRTKLRGSNLVLDATRRGLIDGVVLRVSNVLGPGAPQSSLPGTIAMRLRTACATNERAVLRVSSPHTHRDFVDVLDVADGVAAAVTHPVNGVINLGGGTAVSIRTVVQRLVDISGVPAEIVVESREEVRNSGDWQQLDITAAQRLLAWAPKRGLDDSLLSLWNG